MNEWNLSHPLDISGWSYRVFLLQFCLDCGDSNRILKEILDEDFKNVLSSIQATPENDSLWFYRFLVLLKTNLTQLI